MPVMTGKLQKGKSEGAGASSDFLTGSGSLYDKRLHPKRIQMLYKTGWNNFQRQNVKFFLQFRQKSRIIYTLPNGVNRWDF